MKPADVISATEPIQVEDIENLTRVLEGWVERESLTDSLEAVDLLTEWEIRGPFRREFMNLYNKIAFSISGGKPVITDKVYGEINIPTGSNQTLVSAAEGSEKKIIELFPKREDLVIKKPEGKLPFSESNILTVDWKQIEI
jgi:hypothetical protein